MRKRLIGEYGLFESGVAILFFGFYCYFNYLFFKGVYAGGKVTEETQFMVIFIDLVGLIIVFLPWLTKKAENVSNKTIEVFLDLPNKDSKFTFSAISSFLSDQALASFLATVLVFTGKQVLENYGGIIGAIYVFSLFSVAIVVASVSLIRFIKHFTKYHGAFYGVAAFLSTGVMFAFLNVGVKMAE